MSGAVAGFNFECSKSCPFHPQLLCNALEGRLNDALISECGRGFPELLRASLCCLVRSVSHFLCCLRLVFVLRLVIVCRDFFSSGKVGDELDVTLVVRATPFCHIDHSINRSAPSPFVRVAAFVPAASGDDAVLSTSHLLVLAGRHCSFPLVCVAFAICSCRLIVSLLLSLARFDGGE